MILHTAIEKTGTLIPSQALRVLKTVMNYNKLRGMPWSIFYFTTFTFT